MKTQESNKKNTKLSSQLFCGQQKKKDAKTTCTPKPYVFQGPLIPCATPLSISFISISVLKYSIRLFCLLIQTIFGGFQCTFAQSSSSTRKKITQNKIQNKIHNMHQIQHINPLLHIIHNNNLHCIRRVDILTQLSEFLYVSFLSFIILFDSLVFLLLLFFVNI